MVSKMPNHTWVAKYQPRSTLMLRKLWVQFLAGCAVGAILGFSVGRRHRGEEGGQRHGRWIRNEVEPASLGLGRDSKSSISSALLPPPPNNTYRALDMADAFQSYKYRQHPGCNISSLDLHLPFEPLCQTRQQFLDAYSGGGRIGFDTAFAPRGCDMRWFTTEEICAIFARFEKVIVVGDSMMRHLVGAMNVLLRKDLGYGAVTQWNFDEKESRDCFCTKQFDVKACSVQGIFTTSSVLEHDPNSLACASDQPVDLAIEMMVRFPLDPKEVLRFQELLSPIRPNKPYAIVFGHGLWNDLDLAATVNWLEGIISAIHDRAPYCRQSSCSKLIVTPNAAGIKKADQWILSQGNKALQIFENAVKEEAAMRDVEHMGTWNMSIQMNKWDGVHLDLKGNLIKAMGVMNWLALLD